MRAVREHRLEGIVARRGGSRYGSGERCGDWLKWRANRGQEFVIGGHVPNGDVLDSVLVGYYDRRDLVYAGAVRAGLSSEFRTGVHTLGISVVKTEDDTQGRKSTDTGTGGAGVSAPVPQPQLTNLPGIGAITVEARRSYVLFTLLTLLLVAGIIIEAYALWRFHPVAKAVPVSARRGARGR